MKRLLSRIAIVGFALVSMMAAPAYAGDRATTDEAKALCQKAAANLRANLATPQKAFDDFNSGQMPWRDRDLYISVRTDDGNSVQHATQPAMVGKNHLDLKDVDGKTFVRDIVACKSECWIEYKWKNHSTGAIEQKSNYVVAVDKYRVSVGAYKP